MVCRIPFALVCIIVILGGILVIGLQVVAASTKAWVDVVVLTKTYHFGLFHLQDTHNSITVKMIRFTPLVVMQAMFVFSIGCGLAGIITTFLGMTQRIMCGRGTKFFITLSQIFFALSGILYLIGLATFTHWWTKEPAKFFQSPVIGSTYAYGYAYVIAWFVVMLQFALFLFLVITVNVMIRSQDRQLSRVEETTDERKKLLDKTASSVVEKAVVEGVSEAGDSTTAPASGAPGSSQ